ncbi:MAG: thioesterase [Piscirickettsiaceae bacterium]|nr:MAG: thioesterase [Piscirickettsiaceae bacterium]
MSKQDFTHEMTVPVRWGDADMFGHINNVQYIRYLESGRVAYCEEVLNLPLLADMKVGWLLADIQCAFLQQVHYPENLAVLTRISKIGNKSATVLAEIYREGENKPVITSNGVMVWFDFESQQTTPIPDVIRTKVVAYEKIVEGL